MVPSRVFQAYRAVASYNPSCCTVHDVIVLATQQRVACVGQLRSRVRDVGDVNDTEGRGRLHSCSQPLLTASATCVIHLFWPGPHPCTAGVGTDSLWVLSKFPQAGLVLDLLGGA